MHMHMVIACPILTQPSHSKASTWLSGLSDTTTAKGCFFLSSGNG